MDLKMTKRYGTVTSNYRTRFDVCLETALGPKFYSQYATKRATKIQGDMENRLHVKFNVSEYASLHVCHSGGLWYYEMPGPRL